MAGRPFFKGHLSLGVIHFRYLFKRAENNFGWKISFLIFLRRKIWRKIVNKIRNYLFLLYFIKYQLNAKRDPSSFSTVLHVTFFTADFAPHKLGKSKKMKKTFNEQHY